MAEIDAVVAQNGQLEAARQETVQQRAREGSINANVGLLQWISRGAYLIPAWWSPTRDMQLRKFWKKSDHLAGAIYTMVSKMTAIPFRVVPKDMANRRWMRQAEERTDTLFYNAEFGAGWQVFYSRFIQDLLCQDNGAFAEIIGPGRPDGPLEGAPITIAHLDASRCQRTGHPEYPVIYTDIGGKLYKLHYTRVMHAAQMSSPISEMNGVGLCALSRCLNTGQNLTDILLYKQEKLGSRPHRAILVTQGGLDPTDLEKAFSISNSVMDNAGQSRYAKITAVGERNIPDADVKIHELTGLPDGFDEETSTILGMATIALAFGVDARELFPSMSGGSSRADALLQHLKQRGKGPGQILQQVTSGINYKFLPEHLKIEFEFQDDAEDRQSAEIRGVRAQRRERDVRSEITTTRTERQIMVQQGEITQGQFELMELGDGRLVDGRDILVLLFDEEYADILLFSEPEPDNTAKNDAEAMLTKIATKRSAALKALAETRTDKESQRITFAIFALDHLKELYEESMKLEAEAEQQEEAMRGDRMRRENLARPNPKAEMDTRDSLRPGKDDKDKTLGEYDAFVAENALQVAEIAEKASPAFDVDDYMGVGVARLALEAKIAELNEDGATPETR